MAISVDPFTDVIYVPKADLTLIQSSPEVRELNLNDFHLWLRDWEDDEANIYRPKTHIHNAEATLSGLTYARIIEVLSPYTVEFEDGQYTVNCVGANHNLSDKKVANQVSLIVNNAAGLITNSAIEYSSYNGRVTLDPNSSFTGTLFPVGTPQQPVNNLSDALLIANTRGFITIELYNDLDIEDNSNLDGFTILGRTSDIILTIDSVASVSDLTLKNITITDSTLDGGVHVVDSAVVDVEYVNGHISNCGLAGVITLGGNKKSVIEDCYTIDQDNPPIIDMGVSGNDLAMPNYSGIVTIRNLSGASNEIGVGLDAGMLVLDSTITAGTVIVSGIGVLTDNSGPSVNINSDGILSKADIASSVWSDTNALEVLSDLSFIKGIEGGKWEISGGQMIFYQDDNTTEIARFNLTYDVDQNPVMRERV
jgi:hypothetical protein